MSNVFVISDTWFNRLLDEDQNLSVVDNNELIINGWNKVVSPEDVVYVLGGFGIGDLYHILIRLNGTIHFLNNYFNDEEQTFINNMKDAVDKSSDPEIKNKIVFESNQIMIFSDLDAVLSYFPLGDWSGKQTGTYCFHGFTDDVDMDNCSISCVAKRWEYNPVNIINVQCNIETFKNILA